MLLATAMSALPSTSSPSSISTRVLSTGSPLRPYISSTTSQHGFNKAPSTIPSEVVPSLEQVLQQPSSTSSVASTSRVTLDLDSAEKNSIVTKSKPSPSSSSSSAVVGKKRLLIVDGKVVASPELTLGTSGGRLKKFICSICGQGYTRPTRLVEHERVHTGERPFQCPDCPSTFTRDSHLKAHLRIHTPVEEKRYECQECDKKFWTNQHLKKHVQINHQGKTYDCTRCDQTFRKHHLLRTHIAELHSTPGTFPFICEVEDCDKSFKQKTHLTAHMKIHDPSRYLCIHSDCVSLPLKDRQHPTWSALQKHSKIVHPPTCPFPECQRKTFTTNRGYKNHIASIHDQTKVKAGETKGKGETTSRGRKRRRGGGRRSETETDDNFSSYDDRDDDDLEEEEAEADEDEISEWDREDDKREDRMLKNFAAGGKKKRRIILDLAPEAVWKCGDGDCKRSFKSADALAKHTEALHSNPQPAINHRRVTRPGKNGFAHHLESTGNETEMSDEDEIERLPPLPPLPSKRSGTKDDSSTMLLELITGHNYAPSASALADQSNPLQYPARRFPCPFNQIDQIEHQPIINDVKITTRGRASIHVGEEEDESCGYWFSRVYDVERHLKGTHRVIVDPDTLEDWYETMNRVPALLQ